MSTKHTDPGRLNFRVPTMLKSQLEDYAAERGENVSRACVYLLQRAMEDRPGKHPSSIVADAAAGWGSGSTPMLEQRDPAATYIKTKPKKFSARSSSAPSAGRRRR